MNISVWEKWFSDIYAAKLECRNSLKSLQTFIMIDMNLCRCTHLPSQIPVLVTALSIFSQFLVSKKKKKKKKTEKKVYREVINSENILSKPKRKTKCLAAWRKRVIIEKNSLNIFLLNKGKPRIFVNFISFQKFLKGYAMSQGNQLFQLAAYLRKNGLNLLDFHLKTLMQGGGEWTYIEDLGEFMTKAHNLGWIPEMLFYLKQWVCTSASNMRED